MPRAAPVTRPTLPVTENIAVDTRRSSIVRMRVAAPWIKRHCRAHGRPREQQSTQVTHRNADFEVLYWMIRANSISKNCSPRVAWLVVAIWLVSTAFAFWWFEVHLPGHSLPWCAARRSVELTADSGVISK